MQASKTIRDMGLAFRNRTIAFRAPELVKITPCHLFSRLRLMMREWDSAALSTRMTLSLVHKLCRASGFRRNETRRTEKTKQTPHIVLLALLHLQYVAQQVHVGNMCTSLEV